MRRSLKTRSWNDAEHQLAKLKSSPGLTLEKPKTVAEACDAFLKDAEARKLSPDTLRKQRDILRPLQTFAEQRGRRYLKQLTFEDLADFRASWPDQALSASKKLERLKSFFGFCCRARWIGENPSANLKPPKVKDAPTLPFTPEEMRRLFEACYTYRDNRKRVWQTNARRLLAMLMTLRYTGMRIRDAVQLTDEKVRPGKVFLYQQKTGEPVYVPIPTPLNEALETLPGRTSDRYYFWSGKGNPKSAVGDWQRSFRKLFNLAGFAGHPHRLRDTFAVELLLSGVSMENVSILLGHRSIKTTERSYAPWVRARQQRLEADVAGTWQHDSVLELLEGTQSARRAN